MWRSRRWRKLLNLIDHLPRNSAYVEALANDEDLVEQMLDRSDDAATGPTRRMSEYSADVELLSAISDRIAELIQVTVAVNGAKPQKIQYSPRPITAGERVRRRRRESKHRTLVSRMLPHKPLE